MYTCIMQCTVCIGLLIMRSTGSEQAKQSQFIHSNVTIRTKYSTGRCLTQYTYAPPHGHNHTGNWLIPLMRPNAALSSSYM